MRGYHDNELIERKQMFHLGIAHDKKSKNREEIGGNIKLASHSPLKL
jgi:hypothetical protein